ncbi:MAG: histidine kinase, partial [Myxococcota bacterium]
MVINEVLTPLVVGAVYLALWAAISETVDHDRGLGKLAMHPISVGLALGVYATSWTFFGSVGYARRFGYDFLAISMGVLLSCLAIPVIWAPLARLVHQHNFSSVADLIAYRYQSQAAGLLITVFMLLSMLPYISLQIRTVTETAHFLAGDQAPANLGLVYAIVLGSFAVALGARYADPRAQRPGLIATLAGESLVKLLAITILGAVTLHGHFDGLAGLDAFLTAHPEKLEHMFSPVRDLGWVSLLLVAFFAAFLLPRQFHVAFVESRSPRALRHAMWVLPLLLLLIHLPLPLLYWAGEAKFAGAVSPDRYVLAVADGPLLRLLTFIGGLSASSAMLLVSSMALSAMVVHHAVIPAWGRRDLSHKRLVQMRRAVVAALVVSGFLFHSLVPRAESLVDLGLVSFAAVLQLAPGILGALFWQRGTRRGLVLGICAGTLVWVAIIAIPLL